MDEDKIISSIRHGRLVLTKSELFDHWGNFVLLCFPVTLIVIADVSSPYRPSLITVTLVLCATFYILIARAKLISNKLTIIPTMLTDMQFRQANAVAAKINGWEITRDENQHFSAIRFDDWGIARNKITAILDCDKVYLNSMVYPALRSNPFSLNSNRKTKLELIRQYQSILLGNDIVTAADKEMVHKEEAIMNESEWSLKNLGMKLVGYPIGLGLIGLSIWIMRYGWKGFIVGLLVLGFVGSYFFYDIKVILEKRRRRKTQA